MLYYEQAFDLITYSNNIKEVTDNIIKNIIEEQLDNVNKYKNIELVRLNDNSFELSYHDLEFNRNLKDVLSIKEIKPFLGVISVDQLEYHLQVHNGSNYENNI